MTTRLLVALLSILILFEMTTSFPVSRYHSELESGAKSSKSQGKDISKTSPKEKPDTSSVFARVQRSSNSAHDLEDQRHRHREHGSSHSHLASRDQGKTSSRKASWLASQRKNPKFIAISIFLGCLAFMSLAFAIACCVNYREQSKRVKNATQVDVRSREELSDQVSKIENAHVDVGSY